MTHLGNHPYKEAILRLPVASPPRITVVSYQVPTALHEVQDTVPLEFLERRPVHLQFARLLPTTSCARAAT